MSNMVKDKFSWWKVRIQIVDDEEPDDQEIWLKFRLNESCSRWLTYLQQDLMDGNWVNNIDVTILLMLDLINEMA
jgi:hypothetical protein